MRDMMVGLNIRGHNKQICLAQKHTTLTEATDPLDNSFQNIKLPPSDLS
jgi:hypothetical protein